MEKQFVTFTECLNMYSLAPIRYCDIFTMYNSSHRNFTAHLFKQEKRGINMSLYIDHKAFLEWLHADASKDRKNSVRQRYQQHQSLLKKKKDPLSTKKNLLGYPNADQGCEVVEINGEYFLVTVNFVPLNKSLQVEI